MQETPLDFCNDKRLEYLKEMATEEEFHEFRFLDLRSNEEFLKRNAVLTAEGVLCMVIKELPVSLRDVHAAVTGCGKVGSCVAELLSKNGCAISAFDKNTSANDKFEIKSLESFGELAQNFDCVINTVPELILTEELLRGLNKDCLLIETASAPYGIDFNAADLLGLKTIIAGGIPGKYSPKSAAQLILQVIKKGGKK